MIEVFLAIFISVVVCSLAIRKSNSTQRKAQAILEDIEAHHKFLIAVAAKENRRARWRK